MPMSREARKIAVEAELGESKPRWHEMSLALAAVWVAAIPKPVLDVVGQAPEYWTANRIATGTLVTFVLAVTLLPPLVLAGVLAVLRVGRRFGGISSLFFSGALGALLALAIYHSLTLALGKPLFLIVASIAVAALLTRLYWRSTKTRLVFSIFSGMAVLVPVSFLFLGPTRSLLSGPETDLGAVKVEVELEAPLVVVVFDELSLPSLLDRDGDIDARLFPNFSRLAQTSTWYQNATTNYGTTERALPSLLTGRFQPAGGAGASYRQSPRNLFTLIHAPAGVLALEPLTHLCPPAVCQELATDYRQAVRQVAADFWLVYQNIVVPDRYTARVRPIPKRFRNLASVSLPAGGGGPNSRNGNEMVEGLSEWLAQGRKESLVFFHLNLPHAPYLLNPDGTAYSRMGGYEMLGWHKKGYSWDPQAPFYAAQGFQRYLLQTMFADRILGGILDDLQASGLFRESTLVITADHGVAFTPGQKRRAWELELPLVGANNAVPLLWKSSGQIIGTRSTRNVELIDILPTLLDELGSGFSAGGMDG